MRITSLSMVDGMYHGEYDIEKISIVYNPLNGQGKTTFLRCILYSLGYPIPSTLNVNLERIDFTLTLVKDSGENCIIRRIGHVADVLCGGSIKTYSLPCDQYEMQRDIFGIQSELVLANLLGAYYFDQEKGWIVLNRGKVIGGIHFTIEDFLRGLSDRPYLQEYQKLQQVEREIKKYKQMLEVAEYQTGTKERGEDIAHDTPSEEIKQELSRLYNERRPLDNELSRLVNVVRKNTSFKNYVTAMHLRVKAPDGSVIPVNVDTIEDFKTNEKFLQAKIADVKLQLSAVANKISTLEQRLGREFDLVDVETSIEHFDAEISRIKIDKDAVIRILKDLQRQRKELIEKVRQSIARDGDVVVTLQKSISKYLIEFGIDGKYGYDIFTHDIKRLTGAFFHMLIFAFRISYAKLVREKTGAVLPIIIDSPTGKEVQREKIDKMLEVLERDFKDHQIIIATIYDLKMSGRSLVDVNDGVMHVGGGIDKDS